MALQQHNAQLYGNWFEKAPSKQAALLKPVQLDYSSVLQVFPKNAGEASLPETSFRVGLWNGARKEQEAIQLSVALGSRETKYFPNNCLIRLRESIAAQAFYAEKANIAELEHLLRRAWQPEWLVLQ
nr:Imm52 family immunity protein [Hymenobacter crusticola]